MDCNKWVQKIGCHILANKCLIILVVSGLFLLQVAQAWSYYHKLFCPTAEAIRIHDFHDEGFPDSRYSWDVPGNPHFGRGVTPQNGSVVLSDAVGVYLAQFGSEWNDLLCLYATDATTERVSDEMPENTGYVFYRDFSKSCVVEGRHFVCN